MKCNRVLLIALSVLLVSVSAMAQERDLKETARWPAAFGHSLGQRRQSCSCTWKITAHALA